MITKTTGELNVGDLVVLHGMLIRLDTEPIEYPASAETLYMYGADRVGVVRSFRGLVVNPDDVEDPFIRRWMLYCIDDPAKPRWTVQGNNLATWQVVEGV